MPRKIGDKDKKKRKSRVIDGIRQYPLTKGINPALVGAVNGAIIGGTTTYLRGTLRGGTPSLRSYIPSTIIGAGIGSAVSIGLANSKNADKRLETQMNKSGFLKGVSPENRAGLASISGASLGYTGSGLAIGLANKNRIIKAYKKYNNVGTARVIDNLVRLNRKKMLGAGAIGGLVGAAWSYQSNKELNRRAGKPTYGPLNSTFSNNTENAEFARRIGDKDKQKRRRRIATSLTAAAIGGYLGGRLGKKLARKTALGKDYAEYLYEMNKKGLTMGLEVRHKAQARSVKAKLSDYLNDIKINDFEYIPATRRLPGSVDKPYIPPKGINPTDRLKDYAYNVGANLREKQAADYKRAERYTKKYADYSVDSLGQSYGSTIGAGIGLGSLQLARNKYGTEKKNKKS